MRFSTKKRICFRILYLKKIIAVFVIAAIFAIVFSSFFTRIYKPYIKALAIGRSNVLLQELVNETVLNVLNSGDYGSFVKILKNSQDRITGIDTNTININKFKSNFSIQVAGKLKSIQNERFAIPLLALFNNPFLSEKGPAVYIKIRPIGIVDTDIKSSFVSVGVNQTKHQIDIRCDCKVMIVMPAIKFEHVVSTTMPVSQTVIVGEVPQSYTNITTSQENLDDTVLQLAGN